MKKKSKIKRVVCGFSLIVAVWLIVIWVQFISLPHIQAWKMNAEIMSSRIFLPIVTEKLNAARTNIPYMNGRALVFNQGDEIENKARIIETDGRIYDRILPSAAGESLYRTFRSPESNPLIVIQWGFISFGESDEDWGYEYRFIEIEKDGNIKTEKVRLNNIKKIFCISDKWFTAKNSRESALGKGPALPVAASLMDKKLINLAIKNEDGLSDALIIDDKIVCVFGLSGRRDLILYSLIDKSSNVIGQVIDEHSFPYGWAYSGDMLAWSDRRDESIGKYREPIGLYDIHYYDFSKEKGGVLVADNWNQKYPSLYGDYLFWSDDRNGKKNRFDIYVKNLKTGVVKMLVEGPDDQLYPVYFSGYLYWTNRTTSLMTAMFDLEGQNYVFRKKVELP